MLRFFGCAMMLGFLSLTWAVTPVKPTSAKKTPAKSSKSTARKGATSKAPVRRAAAWRTRQMAPTPDRYKQIQEALATKGYLRPEDATGVWSQTSTDALKKFQAEQNIESSGKINSLSLIALGLGPKHDTAAVKPPAPPPQSAQ